MDPNRTSIVRPAALRLGLLAATILLAAAAAPAHSGASPSVERRAAQLERELGGRASVSVHRETGAARFLGTKPGTPIARPPGVPASSPAALIARAFLGRYGEGFGLRDQASQLRVEAAAQGPRGGSFVRFRQVQAGVPVLGGELVVTLDSNGNLLSIGGEVLPSEELDGPRFEAEPSVGPDEAAATALAVVARGRGKEPADLAAGPALLQVHDSRLLGGPGLGRPSLVWTVEVRSRQAPIRELVLVDAQLGSVVLQLDLIAHAKDRDVCDAANTSGQYPCTAPVRSEGDPAHAVPDVNGAYAFAGDTYDFYFDRFGRDSLDGEGMTLVSTVRWCDPAEPCPYDNAFWDGEQMVYGEDYASADDVVGHELTHGVTEFSSHLFYYYQSGAINESLSDVFGEYVDLTNGAGTDTAAARWLMGEDLPGGAIRNMKNPPAFGDPDRMTSPNYTADLGEGDAGGVHTNSGVNNKAAYLIADGASFNGRTVTGLGVDKAARIYYEAQTALLTSASDYADLYDALNQACANLVGTGGITAADCVEVDDAGLAVEMNQQPPAAPAPEAPTCTGAGTPVTSFFDDLENTASGNWAKTTIQGVNEWYYPQNPNPHDFDATYATSGSKNFWGYNRSGIADYAIGMTSDVTVPSGGFLRFEHAYGFEDTISPLRRWDGGVVEYSTNGGASWTDAGPLFVNNGYNGTIYAGGQANNPLKGRSAFVAESNGYISSRVNLSSLAGQQVRFRFRIGTDSVADDYGWFVDDIRIYRCEVVDTDPPQTTINSGPAGLTNNATPTFTFSSSEPSSSFACRFDSDPFAACSGPGDSHTPASPLSQGPHTFEVRATDQAANTDPTPASRSFSVDSLAPAAPAITDTDPDSPANDNNPEVKGSAEAGSTVKLYESPSCGGAVEAQGTAAAFSSPGLTATVANNVATQFTATATDAAGNTSTCSTAFGYSEDSLAPNTQVDSGPTGPTADATPTFTFSSDEPGSSFACRFDSDPFAACSGPGDSHTPATDLSEGTHTFEVRATDQAGNVDSTPASRGFTVDPNTPPPDTDPPETTIDSGPSGPTNAAAPTFTFSSDELGSTFKCRFDSDPFAACSGPGDSHTAAPPLSEGAHSFQVRATDPAENTDPTPASADFTIDLTDPSSTIAFPDDGAAYRSANFDAGCGGGTPDVCGTAADAVGLQQVEIRIQRASDSNYWNGASWQPGEAWLTAAGTEAWSFGFDPDQEGAYTLSSRATDTAGNVESTAVVGFSIDDTAPAAPAITDTDRDSPANDNNPEVKGSAEAGSTVKLYESPSCGGAVEAQGTAAAFSSPGLTATVANDVATQFTATATDPAGNASTCSTAFGYTEDSTAPTSEIAFPEDGAAYTSANYAAGCADATPDACGTASDGVGLDMIEVRVQRDSDRDYWNGASWQTAEIWLSAEGTGSWSLDFDGGENLYTLSSRATDTAGNLESTDTVVFTVDDTPPAATIDSGPGGLTNDATPTFGFTVEEGAATQCSIDSGAPAFGSCSTPSSHTAGSSLADGSYVFRLRASDTAGNEALATRAFEVSTRPAAGVRCGGKRATITGSPGADVITGTRRRDVIAALGGNDSVRARGGNDLVCGGRGSDKLLGQAGRDRLFGGAGNDALFGGGGRDLLSGQRGRRDRCHGGPGRDARRTPGCTLVRAIP